jgi:hypothetical protein
MVVAMDEDARLREVVVEDEAERACESGRLRGRQGDAEMLRDIPVGEEVELAREKRLVVRR